MSLKTQSFQFGDHVLDVEEKVLFYNGKPVLITPKAFLLLRALIDKRGHLVEKHELMESVWEGSFVEPGNLSFTINVLRKALGDDSHNPQFIETLPRRGYRFIADTTENFRPNGSDTNPDNAAVSSLSSKSRRLPLNRPVFLVFVLGLLMVASWYSVDTFSNPRESAPILAAPFQSVPFSMSGNVAHAIISPDGTHVVYSSETGGQQSVWLRNLDTSENVQIIPPSDDHYLGFAFSRDGRSLFFVRKRSEDEAQAAVYRMAAFGGIPTKIIDKTEGWVSISPDDQQISFVRCEYADQNYCTLSVASIDGGNERRLVTKARPIRIGPNDFSPDGKSISFAAGHSANGGSDFRVLRVDLADGAESEMASRKYFNIKSIKWLPAGTDLLLTAMETLNGKVNIWRLDANSSQAIALTKDAINYGEISLNAAASRMISTQVSNSFRLIRTVDGLSRELTPARSVVLALDGRLIYVADDSNIWITNGDGTQRRQLTSDPSMEDYPVVSPDNRFIFFTSNKSGSNQVWRMDIDGTNQLQLTKNEGGYPCFVSAGGDWVFYRSGLRTTLWKVSTEGGEGIEVSDRKMMEPAISPDGTLVAYFFLDKKKWTIGVSGLVDGKQIAVFDYADGKSTSIKIAWASDNRTLNYVAKTGMTNSLWQQPLGTGKPSYVADLGEEEVADFSLAPDGNGFAFTRGRWMHDAVLIQGLK